MKEIILFIVSMWLIYKLRKVFYFMFKVIDIISKILKKIFVLCLEFFIILLALNYIYKEYMVVSAVIVTIAFNLLLIGLKIVAKKINNKIEIFSDKMNNKIEDFNLRFYSHSNNDYDYDYEDYNWDFGYVLNKKTGIIHDKNSPSSRNISPEHRKDLTFWEAHKLALRNSKYRFKE